MIERLLLNRIDAKPGAAAISIQHHLPVAIDADEAKPAVPRIQATAARTEMALDATVRFGRPPAANRITHVIRGNDRKSRVHPHILPNPVRPRQAKLPCPALHRSPLHQSLSADSAILPRSAQPSWRKLLMVSERTRHLVSVHFKSVRFRRRSTRAFRRARSR